MKEALKQHSKFDHFSTPEYAITPIIQYLQKNWTIWEPTDTTGAISNCLKQHGFNVKSTSFDFLTSNETGFDCIITNPPFSKKDVFIKKCIEYKKPFALLLPLTAFEGVHRGKLWRLIEKDLGVLIFDRRIEFTGSGSVWFNTSWFTYKMLPSQLHFEELKYGRDS